MTLRPDPEKINALENFPRSSNQKTIKQFLGLAGYYRRFVSQFSKIAKPLTDLLKKNKPFLWTESQEHAFLTLRRALCDKPILQYPDFNKPFILTTDASTLGGVLSQGPIGRDLPLVYVSRTLNDAEKKYCTIEKKCFSIIYTVSHFRQYLHGRRFIIITNHRPLVWLHFIKDPTSRL